jgi:ATP-binding cassette, subfamily B, bacterial
MNQESEPTESGGSQDHFSGVRQILRHVGAALRARWGAGLLILGGLLVEMAFNSAVPMSFKYLVDYAIVPRDEKVLIVILAGLTGGGVVVSAAGLGCDYLYARFSTGVLNDLRWRLFTHLRDVAAGICDRS